MKKNIIYIIFSVCILLLCVGCNATVQRTENALDEVEVGVVETSGEKKKSGITFYDADLNKKDTLKLKYATLGDMFCNATVRNGNLYIIPQGYDAEKDEKKVLEINLSNLKTNIYEINQFGMYGLSVDDENIYVCSNLNEVSYIGKCNKKTKEVQERTIKNVYVTQVLAHDGKLYAFGTKMYDTKTEETKKNTSYLYIYDENFELTDTINISKYGDSQDKMISYEDKIYFCNTYNEETELPNNTVCVYSPDSGSIETITLQKNYPLDLNVYNNMLIVSHYDMLSEDVTKGSISFVNLESKEQKNLELDHGADYMTRKGNSLYILSIKDNKLYKYAIDEMSLKLEKEISLEKMYSDNNYYYYTELFGI